MREVNFLQENKKEGEQCARNAFLLPVVPLALLSAERGGVGWMFLRLKDDEQTTPFSSISDSLLLHRLILKYNIMLLAHSWNVASWSRFQQVIYGKKLREMRQNVI